MDNNPTPEEDDRAAEEMSAAEEMTGEPTPEMSRFEAVRAVQLILADVDAIPDRVDGLDMGTFKRLAKSSGEAFATNLTAVLKLAAT